MSVVLIGLSGAASAATPDPTAIRFTDKLLTITYANRQVTVQGTLTGSNGGIAGEPITFTELQRSHAQTGLGTATTGPDGTFSLTTTVPDLGSIRAAFPGDADHQASNWGIGVQPAERLPTRVTLDPLTPVTTDSTLHVTGLAEMQTPDGTWVPAAYTTVWCTNGSVTNWGGRTDGDGRFSLAFYNFDGRGGLQWGVTTTNDTGSFASTAQSDLATVDLHPGQTRINGTYTGTKPATAQAGLNFTGHVDALIDGQWQGNNVNQAYFYLYFQPRGSTTWKWMDYLQRTQNGDYYLNEFSPYRWNGSTYYLAEGSWQARVEPSSTNLWLPSATPAIPIDVTVKTTIASPHIHRSGTTRTLTGTLDIATGPAIPTNLPRALGTKTIKIYYHAKGSHTWHYVTHATTTSKGAFSTSVTHRAHGYYRAVFPASGYYTTTTSSTIYYGG